MTSLRRHLLEGTALLLLGLCGPACTRTSEPPSPTRWTATSTAGKYRATLAPENGTPRIGQLQNWVLTLNTADGRPVYPARIGVNGGMPGHGHGLPTEPQVTEHLGKGQYRIEGLRFNMAGAWVLLFRVETPAGPDQLQIELELHW